jgi:hypothetical protein
VVEVEEIQPEIEAASEPKVEDVPQVIETIVLPEVVIQPQVLFNEYENQLLGEIKDLQSPSKLLNFDAALTIQKDIYS